MKKFLLWLWAPIHGNPRLQPKKIPFQWNLSNKNPGKKTIKVVTNKPEIIKKHTSEKLTTLAPEITPIKTIKPPKPMVLSQEIILNNFKYLSEEFFKLYFYVINYTNTIPMTIAKEYANINWKILEAMGDQGYQLMVNKQGVPGQEQVQLMVTNKAVVKIYNNNIQRYIKILIPQNNKETHYYKPLENNTIDDKNFVFFQDDHHWIMATNGPLNHGVLINQSNVLDGQCQVKHHDNWSYLICKQKKIFFPKHISYKKKSKYLVIRIHYSYGLKFKRQNPKNSNILTIPHVFNPTESMSFVPQKATTFITNNPAFISYNNCIINDNKDHITLKADLPSLAYLLVLYNNKVTNNQWQQDENGEENLIVHQNMAKIESSFQEVEAIFHRLKKTKDLKKDIDLFPVVNIDIINNLSHENPDFQDYMAMIVGFYYGKKKVFDKYFKKYYRYTYYKSFPIINDLNCLNEPVFWLMIYLLPNIPLSKNNILKMVEYSYGFPSIIRDKINSFIIYHLYLNEQFHTINYIFDNNLIDVTLDFMTNFIYIETKKFNGIAMGDDIFHWKSQDSDMNLLKANLQMEQLLHIKSCIKNYSQLLVHLKKILFIYKTYKIFLNKENQNQLLDLLTYVGKNNMKDLENLTQDSVINMNLIINHCQIYNPKLFKKYYKNYKKK
jgi:hypothetical protein